MARPPGLIEHRGQGWRVRIRVDGERYVYGPRSVPLLRQGTREEVEAWVWEEYRRLAKREGAAAAGVITFSALVDQYKEDELADLAPGSQRTYADTLKIAASGFATTSVIPPSTRYGRATSSVTSHGGGDTASARSAKGTP